MILNPTSNTWLVCSDEQAHGRQAHSCVAVHRYKHHWGCEEHGIFAPFNEHLPPCSHIRQVQDREREKRT